MRLDSTAGRLEKILRMSASHGDARKMKELTQLSLVTGTPSHRPAGLKVTVESNTGRHHVPKYEAGDYNQGEFPDEATGVAEWMWVRVHSCDDTNKVVISP